MAESVPTDHPFVNEKMAASRNTLALPYFDTSAIVTTQQRHHAEKNVAYQFLLLGTLKT